MKIRFFSGGPCHRASVHPLKVDDSRRPGNKNIVLSKKEFRGAEARNIPVRSFLFFSSISSETWKRQTLSSFIVIVIPKRNCCHL